MKKYLFIGGHYDGQILDVQYHIGIKEKYSIPILVLEPSISDHHTIHKIRMETYWKDKILTNKENFEFFIHISLTREEALHKLFDNYHPNIRDTDIKIYTVNFPCMYPVGCCLVVAERSMEDAMKTAKETITHLDENEWKEVEIIEEDISKPCVIEYLSGNY